MVLFEAVEQGELQTVKNALSMGVDVNTCDPYAGHLTPLMCAAYHTGSQAAIWKELLARGANPNMVDDEGGTALRRAVGFGNDALVMALLKKGAIVTPEDLGHTWDRIADTSKLKLKKSTVKALEKELVP